MTLSCITVSCFALLSSASPPSESSKAGIQSAVTTCCHLGTLYLLVGLFVCLYVCFQVLCLSPLKLFVSSLPFGLSVFRLSNTSNRRMAREISKRSIIRDRIGNLVHVQYRDQSRGRRSLEALPNLFFFLVFSIRFVHSTPFDGNHSSGRGEKTTNSPLCSNLPCVRLFCVIVLSSIRSLRIPLWFVLRGVLLLSSSSSSSRVIRWLMSTCL